jgi:hypothetical protein
MTLVETRASGRPAYCYLSSGAVLRFSPDDGTVRYLEHPEGPAAWRWAQLYRDDVPDEGWQHLGDDSMTS